MAAPNRKVLVALNVDSHEELPSQAKSVSDFISVLSADHGGSEAFEIDVQVGVNSSSDEGGNDDGTPYIGFVNTTAQNEPLPFEDDDDDGLCRKCVDNVVYDNESGLCEYCEEDE